MRRLALVVALLVAPAAVALDAQVVAVRHGRTIVVADRETLVRELLALAESCTVDSTDPTFTRRQWKAAAELPSHLRVVFPDARGVSLAGAGDRPRAVRLIHEIRLPLPDGRWPAQVLLAGRDGLLSLTKYDPLVLRRIVSIPGLDLGAEAPYGSRPASAPR